MLQSGPACETEGPVHTGAYRMQLDLIQKHLSYMQ